MKTMDFDDFMDSIGGSSRHQIFSVMGTATLCFTLSLNIMIPSLQTATPSFRCNIPHEDASNFNYNFSMDEILKIAIPNTGNEHLDSCYRYAYNLTACYERNDTSCFTNINTTKNLVKCDHGFIYDQSDYQSTAVTEWDLVCERKILKSTTNSMFFFGCFLGSLIFGQLADWFGRRFAMLISVIGNVMFGMGVAFAPTYEVHLVFYAAMAACAIGGNIVTYTYVGEISNKKRRRDMILMNAMFGSLGNVFIALLAHFIRDWRFLEVVCSLFSLIYIPVYFLSSESPRWLLSVGKDDQAKTVVEKYLGSKGISLNEKQWNVIVESENEKRNTGNSGAKYSVLDLFKTRNLRLISLNVMFTWFVSSMVYYGLVLNVGNLAGNPYVNTAINSSMDVIATAAMFILTKYFSKTTLLCISFFISGLNCLSSMLLLQYGFVIPSSILACIGRLGASCSYRITYVLTTELYPTVIRGIGLSLGSLVARIGGMISPFTLQAHLSIPWLMQTIFGSLALVAGMMSLIYPDTNNMKLTSTLQEAEEFCANNLPHICGKREKTENVTSHKIYKVNTLV